MRNGITLQLVVTWQDPHSQWKINITPEQEEDMQKAGFWPKGPDGTEYCEVYCGLHYGVPTYTDEDISKICNKSA